MARRLLATLLFLLLAIAPAAAQDAIDREIAQTTRALREARDVVTEDLIAGAAEVEQRIRALRDASRERLEPLQREIDRLSADRSALGDPPGENDAPEAEALTERRASLNSRIAELRSQEVQIAANIAEATDLLAELSTRRVGALYRDALERGPSIFAPALWREALGASPAVIENIGEHVSEWTRRLQRDGGLWSTLALIAGAVAISLLLFGPANRWIAASFTSRIERFEPTRDRRVAVAGFKMIAYAAPGIVGGLIIFEALRAAGFIGESGSGVARAAWFALVAVLLVQGFVSGLFASRNPQWRVAPLKEEQARRAGGYVVAIVAIFGLKTVLAEIGEAAGAAAASGRILDGTSAVAIGILLFLLCRRDLWRAPPEQAGARALTDAWRPVRALASATALLTAAAPFAGYVAFANFVSSRFYFLALILAVAWFARALLREIAAWAERRLRASAVRRAAEDSKPTIDQFWINTAIDALFLVALTPALLVVAGFHWGTIADLVGQAFFGFRIGGVEIPSLASILIAIACFVGVLGLTRLLQRGLADGPFAHSRLDVGVQNSLTTLIGYIGLVLALVVAITMLGVNLSNLAIIAGALSVGIGFGLQSVVNNFVSGLILLFERPIKVGDWVVTQSGEGVVKKISVRSTEIETFDRSSIIVPNSELIAQTVTNWTHRDKIGRITVGVGVSYESDPEQVKEILLKCAREHPLVVRYPEPFVVWKDFGPSSLDFEIRAFLRDISMGLTAKTDLRFAIFKAFKEAGVEIPFPQHDVHFKAAPAAGARGRRRAGNAAPAASGGPVPPLEPEMAEDE